MSKNRFDRKLLLCAAAFSALVGCASEPESSVAADDESPENAALLTANRTATLQAPPAPDGGVTVPNPAGTYFVSVTPNGTGCPPGTTNTSISADGLVFTTTFSAYEVQINNQTPDLTITKNCTLQIKLNSPNGISYAVTSFFYSGYAFLEQGVTASQQASYRFQGVSTTPKSNRTTKVGPIDEDFVFRDDVATSDVVWSPCGVERELIVNTQMQLRNSSPKRSGYANLAAIDGSTKLELRLAFRGCNGQPIPAPVLPDAGVVRGGN